jgi:response regulator of citrate/malate metabolism
MRIAGDLKDRLILSQEQEEKLRDILEKFSKDQQEVFEKYNQEKQDSAVLKNALLETEKSFEKGLSNILTKEQMEAYRKAKDSGAIKLSPRGMP